MTKKEKRQEKEIRAFRTPCCGAEVQRMARATYRCQECFRDVSLAFVMYVEAVLSEKPTKQS